MAHHWRCATEITPFLWRIFKGCATELGYSVAHQRPCATENSWAPQPTAGLHPTPPFLWRMETDAPQKSVFLWRIWTHAPQKYGWAPTPIIEGAISVAHGTRCVTEMPLSVAHPAACATESSISVAHGTRCAIELLCRNTKVAAPPT